MISAADTLSKLMTAKQYAEIEHETPYIFELQNDHAHLLYFGARHTATLPSDMFDSIRHAFERLQPRVVFVEGLQTKSANAEANTKVASMSYAEVIHEGGEPMYTVKLAVEHDVHWRCPEPEDADLYRYLEQVGGYSRQQLAAWNVLHVLPQWQRQETLCNFEDYAAGFIRMFKQATQWEGFDYSYEHTIKIAEEILGRKIKLNDEQEANDRIDPIPWPGSERHWSVINEICQASSRFRDEEIVRQIYEEIEKGGNIFVVYGSSHAAMQEPAFKYLFRTL